ncbi:MAG: EexN family lipoprotein [Woeseia sp.]
MRRAAPPRAIFFAINVCVVLAISVSCTKEPPPRTVVEFVENPRLLEATMVRCAQNRSELRYTPECVNAREAVNRIAATEEAARRSELDAQSIRKREALRRAQQAAAEARERSAEFERLREEAEYLGQFESVSEPMPGMTEGGEAPPAAAPGERVAPENSTVPDPVVDEVVPETLPDSVRNEVPEPSLESVREELQRRQQQEAPR